MVRSEKKEANPNKVIDEAIIKVLKERGPLTCREIAHIIGVAPAKVLGRLRALKRRGIVK